MNSSAWFLIIAWLPLFFFFFSLLLVCTRYFHFDFVVFILIFFSAQSFQLLSAIQPQVWESARVFFICMRFGNAAQSHPHKSLIGLNNDIMNYRNLLKTYPINRDPVTRAWKPPPLTGSAREKKKPYFFHTNSTTYTEKRQKGENCGSGKCQFTEIKLREGKWGETAFHIFLSVHSSFFS